MKITVLEKKKNKLYVELEGADHTLCNALKKALWEDKNVTVSGYYKDHMQVGNPKLVVEVASGNDAVKALSDAVKRVKKTNAGFLKAFASAK